ncbi:MAG TPA: flagellar hook-length control protein [Burkholderiaceae bacterium]
MFWPLLCWLSAGFGLFYMNRGQRIYHLDISGTGQIRLRCRHSHSPPWIDNAEKPATEAGILVTLLADSTMWPGFLMLRLKTGDGYLYNIPILPDSLPRDSFRAISVACRWIAAHEFKP